MTDIASDNFDPAVNVASAEGLENAADGHIELQGLHNTRDIGGIAVADGRYVKHALLLRSGALAGATEHDLEVLVDTYNVRTVIDLRTEEEVLVQPDPIDKLEGVRYVSAPLVNPASLGITHEGGIKGMLQAIHDLGENPADLMARMYVTTVLDKRGQQGFARFFEAVLSATEGSVLWHCTAGKDRTGMTAALLLHVLGASDESILADYLASNQYLENRTEEVLNALAAHGIAGKLDASVRVLNSVRAELLIDARDAVVKHYGSVDAYLQRALGITDEKRNILRERYLTENPRG